MLLASDGFHYNITSEKVWDHYHACKAAEGCDDDGRRQDNHESWSLVRVAAAALKRGLLWLASFWSGGREKGGTTLYGHMTIEEEKWVIKD